MKPRSKPVLTFFIALALVICLGVYLRGVFANDSNSGHITIGKNYLVRGSYDRAIREFSRALKINPKDPTAYVDRGTAYNQQEKYAEAISDFSSAISLKPDSYLAFNNRGVSYFRQGNLDKAIQDFSKAISMNPDDPYARLNFAGAALAAGKGRAAADKLTTLIQNSRWKGRFAGQSAVLAILAYNQVGQSKEANELLGTSLKKVSRLDWPYGALQYLQGKISPDELLESVKNSDYDTTQAHCFIALNLVNKNKPKLARGHLNWVTKYGTPESLEYWLAKNISAQTGK